MTDTQVGSVEFVGTVLELMTLLDLQYARGWFQVNDAQTPNWVAVVDTQVPGWIVIDDNQ
jgi:hypothetical protein